jgi:two-component system NtrC family sensor kinase
MEPAMNQTLNNPADEATDGRAATDGERAAGSNSRVEGRYERIKAVEEAHRALLARPRVSLHLQINLAFFLIFLFVLGISVALVLNMYSVENRLRWLELVNEYVVEIDQTRRFEKNYFLYGTNLNDALENAFRANDLLDRNSEEIGKLLGEGGQAVVLQNIKEYEGLLQQLEKLEQKGTRDPEYQRVKHEIEPQLRKYGHQLLSYGQDLMRREKKSLTDAIARSRHITIYALIILLIFLGIHAFFLGTRLLRTIKRFSTYAQRIASGDYTPIMPARSYRDEFTELALAFNRMIQDLENREAVLIQSHKMRAVGTLTAGVAHELNNPLNNITLTADMLLEDYDTLNDAERKEMIGDVVNEAGRSKKIISNLLDFARESGSQLEPLDLVHLLKETIDLASNQIKLSGIKIEFQTADNLPRVHGDIQQLEQVFLNLILNAIDASPKGSKIQVILVPADDPHYLAVKIIDFGSGIPRHILSSIFDPFFTTKGKGKGTGLGLSVSQGIVAKHGGRIRVSSQEGAGSSFTVTLPVTTIPAEIGARADLHQGQP